LTIVFICDKTQLDYTLSSKKMTIRNLQASILLWLVVILGGSLSTVFLDPILTGGNTKAVTNLVSDFKSEKKNTPQRYINNGKYEVIKPPKEYDGSLRFYYNDQANRVQVTKDTEADPAVKKKLEKLELQYREQAFRAQY
jgi:hypothetical protein